VKDSSGDWNNTKAMLDAFAAPGFDVFAGSEVFLLQNMRHGGVGCITATGNVNPGAIDHLYRHWRAADADRMQAEISATRAVLQKFPMIAALKATVAHFAGDPEWGTVRPPLVALSAEQQAALVAGLRERGFDMPGIRG
jgi:4-hydroxy-tetrahydrodipicolinate synthase